MTCTSEQIPVRQTVGKALTAGPGPNNGWSWHFSMIRMIEMAAPTGLRIAFCLLVCLSFASVAKSQTCAFSSITGSGFDGYGQNIFYVLPGGGTGTLTINFTAPGCEWTIESSQSWITFDGPTSGVNTTTSVPITVNVPDNSSPSFIAGTITVTVNEVTEPLQSVYQNSNSCTVSLPVPSATVPAAGGNFAFTVDSGSCWFGWTGPNVPWITITSVVNYTINYSVAANTGPERSGSITINQPTPAIPFNITQSGALQIITSSPLPAGTQGSPYSEGVAVSGGTAPYLWTISGGTLPPGLSLDSGSCGIEETTRRTNTQLLVHRVNARTRGLPQQEPNVCLITGSPSSAQTANFTMQVTDVNGSTGGQSFQLTINPPPTLSFCGDIGGWIAGSPLTLSPSIGACAGVRGFTVSGGTPPYTWLAPALPPGMSINATSGVISGAPTAAGLATFSVFVTDAWSSQAQSSYSFSVYPLLSMSCLPTTGPVEVGVPYSATCTASGTAPYVWSTPPALPAGLSMSSANGGITISGTPTSSGSGAYSVTVTDSTPTTDGPTGPQTQSQPYSYTITNSPTITTSSPLPSGTQGALYSQGVTVSAGTAPYTWSISANNLPQGLSLDPDSCGIVGDKAHSGARILARPLKSRIKPQQDSNVCLITGTPTTSSTYNFTMMVVDTYGASASAPFTLTINTGVIVNSTPLPGGTVGVAYSAPLTASGGTPPYSNWTVSGGTLPTGLTLSSASGVISGTPATVIGSPFSFSVTVGDSAGNTSPPRPCPSRLSVLLWSQLPRFPAVL